MAARDLAEERRQYLLRLSQLAPNNREIGNILRNRNVSRTRAFCSGLDIARPSPADIINRTEQKIQLRSDPNRERLLCVVEEIDATWIAALGTAWNIPHDFFINYATNPKGDSLWDCTMWSRIVRLPASGPVHEFLPESGPSHRNDRRSSAHRPLAEYPGLWEAFMTSAGTPAGHINGVVPHLQIPGKLIEHRRRFEHSPLYGWQANTRISYYGANPWLTLFLVDAPYAREPLGYQREWPSPSPSRLSFWVPYSANRGGLPIPQLYDTPHFALFECLQSFASHPWHLKFISHRDSDQLGCIHPQVFVYVLSASLWSTNLAKLDSEVKKIAFYDLKNPTIDINNRLHDLCRDLDTLRTEVALASSWVHENIRFLCTEDAQFFMIPQIETFNKVLKASETLERFLTDTFQLLMSFISVKDAQTSIEEASRSTRLAQLATIYIPISFVTGIFGMNLKGYPNGFPRWWLAIAVVVVVLSTVALLWILSLLEDLVRRIKGVWRRKEEGRIKAKFDLSG